jgi:hypothetical protein
MAKLTFTIRFDQLRETESNLSTVTGIGNLDRRIVWCAYSKQKL